ncbi:MAG TPA: c-type cytochrome, partial [Segetibacter sp.]|nr:c-type cytochrome [Segetibacter sp.]
PELKSALFALQKDNDPKVRFQLLCTIGFLNTPEAAKAREKLLFENLNDNWLQVAALSARSSQAASLLNVAMNKFKPVDPAYASLAKRLASMIGSGGEVKSIRNIISKATLSESEKQTWQPAVLEGLADGLERRKIASSELQNEQEILIKTFFENPSSSMREAAVQLLKAIGIHDELLAEISIKKAVSIMQDRSMPDEKREEAINFLSLHNPVVYQAQLKKLIVPQEQATVQLAALKTLSLIPGLTVSQYILKQWPVLTPEIRDAAISTFLSSPDRVSYLLDAIDSGRIHRSSFSFIQGVQLMTGGDDKLRKRARSIFAHNDAAKVNKEYQQALKLKGDQLKGKTVFIENCALCHQVKGQIGVPFGPDLGTVSKWQPEGIMANIVDPNLSIAAKYELWVVELNNGESLQGIIASETANAITLKSAGRAEKMIKRSDIKSLKTLPVSAMPAGLEKNISPQKMADLLAFLRQNK